MNMRLLKIQFKAAEQALVNAGWEKAYSVMCDCPKEDGSNFGVCYLKDGAKFMLNVVTINKLPV